MNLFYLNPTNPVLSSSVCGGEERKAITGNKLMNIY